MTLYACRTALQNTTVVVNINHCLQRCGLDPDTPPLNPNDPTGGPSSKPLNRDQVQILCIQQTPEGQAKDCTSLLHHTYNVGLGWSIMSKQFDLQAQTFTPQEQGRWADESLLLHPASDVSADGPVLGRADASGTALVMQQPVGIADANGQPQYLFAKRVDF